MARAYDFRFEELREDGGSHISFNHPHGFIDAHVGSPEYVTTHSYAYEHPALVSHIASAVRDTEIIAYINHVSVDEGHREKGLGTDLMKRMLQELKTRGVRHVYGHMAEWEGPPRLRLERWLRKFGFEVINCSKEDVLPVVALTLK